MFSIHCTNNTLGITDKCANSQPISISHYVLYVAGIEDINTVKENWQTNFPSYTDNIIIECP